MIYLDNAATTKTDPKVVNEMLPYYTDCFYNPSAGYRGALDANSKVNEARRIIAKSLGVKPETIFFTSGGTESDNLAIRGVIKNKIKNPDNKNSNNPHIITTEIEHHAVLNTVADLEKRGVSVTRLKPDKFGIINPSDVKAAIKSNTVLISVMVANNEIGTIQPIKGIGEIAKESKILFHTDAVQAYGHTSLDLNELNVDFLSASAHKFHGPKGVGFLYVKDIEKISPVITGGSQERNLRPGTLNVPLIVGMGIAADISFRELRKREIYLKGLRDKFLNLITEEIKGVQINGHATNRLTNNLNIRFKGISSDTLLSLLYKEEIYASKGSACTRGLNEASHVLTSIGLSDEEANESIRFSLSYENTYEEIEKTVEVLKEKITKLKSLLK